MRSSFLLIAATLTCLSVGVAAAAGGQSGRMPSFIPSTLGPTSYSLWISADSVVDEQGDLIWDALPIGFRISAEKLLKNGEYEKYGCFQLLGTDHQEAGPIKRRSSLKDLALNSWAIFQGTVTDIDQGFGVGNPALLLEIQVDERLKASEKFSSLPYLYLVYPKGEFEAGGYRFCARDWRWPDPPQIGDRVLLFPYRVPYDPADQVIVPDPAGFEMILEKEGALAIPRDLRDDPDLIGVKDFATVRKHALAHLREARERDRREQ